MPRSKTPPPPTRTLRAVLSCMRNEGIWLLEWVAYYRAIGFDRIFVASNDCTDGTDAMLDRLADMGHVIHLRNVVPPGVSPQESGCRMALAHPDMGQVDWLLHVDTDEFLNITAGEGRIGDLLSTLRAEGWRHPVDCIAIAWRMFGPAGRRVWDGGNVLETFTRTEGVPKRFRTLHKCLFRPNRFASVYSHMPKAPVAPDVILKNARGQVMPSEPLFEPTTTRHREGANRKVTWENAVINHYAIRSEDVFVLKNLRGDGLAKDHVKYYRGSAFWKAADMDRVEDTSIQRHLPATLAILAEYRADPVLGDLERQAFAAFAALRQRVLFDEGQFGWNDPNALAPVSSDPDDQDTDDADGGQD